MQLTLWQCDICGYAQFTTLGHMGQIGGAEITYNSTAATNRICEGCVAHLDARRGMFELTGDAAKPCKMSVSWPPDREQTEDRPRSS